jgi:hypothetical protein
MSANPSPHTLPILILQGKVESLYFFFSKNVLCVVGEGLYSFYTLQGQFGDRDIQGNTRHRLQENKDESPAKLHLDES